jgi:hypothetical protein
MLFFARKIKRALRLILRGELLSRRLKVRRVTVGKIDPLAEVINWTILNVEGWSHEGTVVPRNNSSVTLV